MERGSRAHRATRRGKESDTGPLGQRAHDALTDLNAYALRLDAERQRLADRLLELAETDSSVAERRAVLRARDEIVEELAALRGTIAALHEQVREAGHDAAPAPTATRPLRRHPDVRPRTR